MSRIKTFKEFINESVWGGMLDRSTGDSIRKEDDIITYDGQRMVEYIIKHYRINYSSQQPRYDKDGDALSVPVIIWHDKEDRQLYHTNFVFYDYEPNVVYVSDQTHKDTLEKIKSNPSYLIETYEYNFVSIRPKKGDVNNRFLLEVIDFILDITKPTSYPIPDDLPKHILDKKKVNESVWGGMLDRSVGDTVRKEDDVNNLDIDGLGEYILDHYNIDDGNIFYKDAHGKCIGLSIFYLKLENDDLLLEYFFNDDYNEMVVTTYRGIEKYFPDMFYKMKKEYKIYDTEAPNGMMALYGISPKDGREVDNKFYLEILDFIIDNFERIHPNIRKIIDKK